MHLIPRQFTLTAAIIAVAVLTGCASYRTDSNISSEPTPAAASTAGVLIMEGIPDKKFKEVGPIEVSVKKLTVFHQNPTKEQANEALVERARIIGADAVIKVTYQNGIGFTTWGYMDAKGIGVKFGD